MSRKALLLLGFLLVSGMLSAQKLDSLKNELKKQKQDTNYVKTLREITYYYLFDDFNVALALKSNEDALKAAKKVKSDYWIAKLYALKAYIEHHYSSRFDEAIQANFKALRHYDKIKNEKEKLPVYINLGSLYFDYGQFEDAEKYLKLGEEITLKYNIEEDYALISSNLGSVYDALGKEKEALKYLNGAREYYLKIKEELEVARMDFSIANIKVNNKSASNEVRKECIKVYEKVYPLFKQFEQYDFYVGSLINIGIEYNFLGDPELALKYLIEAEREALKLNNFKILTSVYSVLSNNALLRKNFEEQATYLQKMIVMNDSLFNENKTKAISEVQIKYQTDKIESENELLMKNSEIKDLELSKKDIEIAQSNTIKFALIGGLTLIIVFTTFLYNRFKVTNQQKKTIEQQKLLVEIKQKEITDSIKYAKRLQEAILPSQQVIKKYFPDSFLLYKPKDIVAGDFYFFEVLNDTIFIAAADCTGHGVPGAMVSVVCSNALHRCIKEFNIQEPGKILDKTRELVVETFEKSGQEVKDGMDIALCAIKKNKILFAGANNPCWILRGDDYIVLPADKQPIGKFEKSFPYTTVESDLQKGDLIYIFTDGYNDQFGGKDGKKFKAKNFYRLLKTIQYYKMEEQKREIDQVFEKWKGSLEQIDDVCLIGIRI